MTGTRKRLAVIVSHPIQYVAPLHRRLASRDDLDLRVFFTWHAGEAPTFDRGFRQRECGSDVLYNSIVQHRKTIKHQNLMNNILFVDNSRTIDTCACGRPYMRKSRAMHNKSKFHQNYLNNQTKNINHIDILANATDELKL